MATLKLYTVGKLLRSQKLVMFSKTFCPFCKLAKSILRKAGVSEMKVVELDELEEKNGNDIQHTLKFLTGQNTVPSVFIGGKFLGGATETEKLYKSGKLTEILKSNNVL